MRTIIIICLTFITLIGAWTESKAVDFSIGAATWYSSWKMKTSDSSLSSSYYKPGLLYGPVYSLSFNKDWSLSGVLLFGQFKQKDTSDKTTRKDVDTTLNYNINTYFKIFAGAKYMGYTGPGMKHNAVGPAIGAGITAPIFDNLFILGNISGMYLRGKEQDTDTPTLKFKEYGYNTSLTLTYYIESITSTVNIGYRYQRFNIKYNNVDGISIPKFTSIFHGPTLSFVYNF